MHLQQILKEGGWTLVRQKKHYIYKREVITRAGTRTEQTFTTYVCVCVRL